MTANASPPTTAAAATPRAVARNHTHMRLATEHLQAANPPPALYDDILATGARYLA